MVIKIKDTGIGIDYKHLPRLFERFYRVDKGRSRDLGGTGLGLSIVKHIVNLYNGNVKVNSKLGEGTEFIVQIPVWDFKENQKLSLSMKKSNLLRCNLEK